jgi:hypothetical protein
VKYSPNTYEAYLTGSYAGIDRKFGGKLDVKAVAEDLRAWRTVSTRSGISQNLRPAGTVHYTPNHSWDVQVSSAYSSVRSFHVYDQIDNTFAVTYSRPFRRKFNDDSGEVILQYPIRFSGGVEEEDFFNFPGNKSQQLKPYIRISLF